MTLRNGLLAAVNKIRGTVPRSLGLRPHTVTVRVRAWSGTVAGEGIATDNDTVLTTGDGVSSPRVQAVSSKDVIASGGLLSEQDIKIGPFSPDFSGGGISENVIDPPTVDGTPQEILFRVTGPGMGTDGRWFRRLNDAALANFSRWLYLRANADQP